MNSPTQRSLAKMRKEGWQVCVVEKWIAQARQRFDAFGFGDLLACQPGQRITLVQTTSRSNMMARYHKIIGLPSAETWLRSGGKIILHGWSKKGARGERKLWQCAENEITLLEIQAQRDELFTESIPMQSSA